MPAARWPKISLEPLACLAIACLLASGLAAQAAPGEAFALEASLADGRQALAEARYLDVSRVLTRAALARVRDPRLSLLEGELDLRSGRPDAALEAFRTAAVSGRVPSDSLQGEGLALFQLGRWDEATATLEKAVQADPRSWRAWNALGASYDRRSDWTQAAAAYEQALQNTDQAAIVLNNRGYSRLLQHSFDAAVGDLTAALKRDPGLAPARTNLRLALALSGDYPRALAVPPLLLEEPGAVLNNVAVAAASRGDFAEAQVLLRQAIQKRSVYYATAEQNLKVIQSFQDRPERADAR